MYTFQLIIRFENFEENERKRYGAAGQMLALGVSTTPMASPEGNYAVFYLISEYRVLLTDFLYALGKNFCILI